LRSTSKGDDVRKQGLGTNLTFVGNLRPAMGARNQVGIGLSYRPASLCSLATQFQTRFLELIPRPVAGLKFSALVTKQIMGADGGGGEAKMSLRGRSSRRFFQSPSYPNNVRFAHLLPPNIVEVYTDDLSILLLVFVCSHLVSVT
jgi:hypothetical protein